MIEQPLINHLSFPRGLRLTTKADFQTVFDQSSKVNQKFMLVLYRANQKPHARLGMLVGKRAVSDAADRNRIKRILRESFRHCQEKLKGFDVVVIVRHQCDTLSSSQLREGIENLWEKLQTHYQNSLR